MKAATAAALEAAVVRAVVIGFAAATGVAWFVLIRFLLSLA